MAIWIKELRNIFVISIRSARRRECRQRLGHLAQYVKSWKGVNGQRIKMEKLRSDGVISETCQMRRGQIGCFQSHKRIWEWCVRSKCGMALVLEDDATLKPDRRTAHVIKKALRNLRKTQPDWDILLLARNHKNRHDREAVADGIVRTGPFWGLFSYIVSQKGAQRLIALENVKVFHRACDVVISNHAINDALNVFALRPCLCTYSSTFSDTRRIK